MLAFSDQLIAFWPIRTLLFAIALFYGFGAVVHIMNMLGLTGQDWADMPPLWRTMDVVFLVLNFTVVIGVLTNSGWGVIGFVCAALLQIGLYTLVPHLFAATPEQARMLQQLVYLHLGLIGALGVLAWVGGFLG